MCEHENKSIGFLPGGATKLPLACLKNVPLRLRTCVGNCLRYMTRPKNANKQFPDKLSQEARYDPKPSLVLNAVVSEKSRLPYAPHQTARPHSYYRIQPRQGCGVTPEGVGAETSRRHPCRRTCQALETLRNNGKFSTRQQGVLVLHGSQGGEGYLPFEQCMIAVIVGWQQNIYGVKHNFVLLASGRSSNDPTRESPLFAKLDLGIVLEMELAQLRCGDGFVAEYPGAKKDTGGNEHT